LATGELDANYESETDASFSIEWKGNYRIEGAAFVFVDRKTRGPSDTQRRSWNTLRVVAEISNIFG
jgi:hypothetical protein